MSAPRIGPATAIERAAAIALADEVFLRSRGRSGTLAGRLPALAGAHAVVAREGGDVVGAALWRPFAWHDGEGRRWRAAMVGLVATSPAQRGRGIAGAVLEVVRERLERERVEVAVLWAGRPDLYLRAGWTPADPGVRAELPGAPGAAVPGDVQAAAIDAEVAQCLLALHGREPQRVDRGPVDFLAVPPPSSRTWAYVAGDAYAVAGEAHLYEVVGDPAAYPALWDAVCAGRERVTVNDRRDGAFARWLAAEHGAVLEDQRLALWLDLGVAGVPATPHRWHVPWLDRI